jgi:hypothetical protein
VVQDIPDYCVVVGNPARVVKKINHWENKLIYFTFQLDGNDIKLYYDLKLCVNLTIYGQFESPIWYIACKTSTDF